MQTTEIHDNQNTYLLGCRRTCVVRYSREDALSEREFVLLLEGAERLKEWKQLQTKFVIMAAGRMGMRGGEIAHVSTDWVNESKNTISIPQHDRCTKGSNDGEICGYCRHRVEDYLDTHNKDRNEIVRNIDDEFGDTIDDDAKEQIVESRLEEDNEDYDNVKERWWQPKTDASVRTIPYDFNVRLQLTIERFFDQYDQFPKSKATINRRIDAAAEASELEKNVYPHCLRATAATTHASRDVSPYALMSVMGWRDMDTARTYVAASDESAAREIRSQHR